MFNRYYQRVLRAPVTFLLISSPLWALGFPRGVQFQVDHGCFLHARSQLEGEPFHESRLARLDQRAQYLLKNQSLNYADQKYATAYFARIRGDLSRARNNWFEYLEFRKRSRGFVPDQQYKEVMVFFQGAEKTLKKDFNRITSLKPKKRKTRRKRKHARPAKFPKNTTKELLRSAQSFLEKGDAALKRGRFEEASRFYRLSKRIQPDLDGVDERIARVDALMQ